MKKAWLGLVAWPFASSIYAQTPAPASADASSCEAKAVDKTGKPLVGAAKASSIKKCEKSMKSDKKGECEKKDISAEGKPLHGAAKSASVKKCMTE